MKISAFLLKISPLNYGPLTCLNFLQVLTALKRVIASDKLYDPQNPTVVLCDQRLEEALDVKALHVSEIRYTLQLR